MKLLLGDHGEALDDLRDISDGLATLGDETGLVADVELIESESESDLDETVSCIRNAISDLSFPCLAEIEICPDFSI